MSRTAYLLRSGVDKQVILGAFLLLAAEDRMLYALDTSLDPDTVPPANLASELHITKSDQDANSDPRRK